MPEARRHAAVAGHKGDDGTATSLLAHRDGGVRALALGALARMGRLDPGTAERALDDPDTRVRRRALEAIAEVGDSQAHPLSSVPITGLLADTDASVAETAAWACGERLRREPGDVELLVKAATGHADPLVREAAVAALGAIGDEAGLAAILAAATDRPAIRRRAVLALAPFEGPEVDAALTHARADRDWQVRQAAEDLGGPADP